MNKHALDDDRGKPCKKIAKTSSRKVNCNVNSLYLSSEFKESFKKFYNDKISFCHDSGAEIITKPFTCCILPNFIKEPEFLDNIKDELLDLGFYERETDLYKFHQSDDLKTLKVTLGNHIKTLRKLLYENFLDWLKYMTGIPLNNTVDMSCARYDYTDVLLCHDDQLEGRRIAFIFYLVPTWCQEDGGMLDLFCTDENDQPLTVEKSIVPAWNNFVFFEVTPLSFHQVSEVLTQDKTRLSISGWFHGPPVQRPSPYLELEPDLREPIFVDCDDVKLWINPIYLDINVQMQIQEKFQNDSEIQLRDFLVKDKYNAVAEALMSNSIKWNLKGPANKRHLETAEEDSLPSAAQECLKFLQSEIIFFILSHLTGIRLHDAAEEYEEEDDKKKSNHNQNASRDNKHSGSNKSNGTREPSRCRLQVRQWAHGSYTLLHDDRENEDVAVDATLYFNCDEWKMEYGGHTEYIAKGEDEQLLTVYPVPNSLSLVYRDQETLRFVKHINSQVQERNTLPSKFQDFAFVYYQ